MNTQFSSPPPALAAIGLAEIFLIILILVFLVAAVCGLFGLVYLLVRALQKSAPAMPRVPATLSPELLHQQQKRDREQLKLLAIFHFVLGGLALVGIGFLVLHYSFMHTVFGNPEMWKSQPNPPPFSPAEFLRMFVWFYLFTGALLVAGSVLNVLSGMFLWQRRYRMFSMLIAGLNCLQVPLGTVLGVFTLLVLSRESVQELYPDSEHTS